MNQARPAPGRAWRLPLLAVALLTLVLAVLGGLTRLGWPGLPTATPAGPWHGPLMISGFLGTLISLERAVALQTGHAYLAPLLAALGAVALLRGEAALAAGLATGASLWLTGEFVAVLRRQPSLFLAVIGSGVVAWLIGNLLWWWGRPLAMAVPWWAGFLVLTIVGERLELSRVLPRTRGQLAVFGLAGAVYVTGLLVGLLQPAVGALLAGLGMLGLAFWLARYDLARRTIRRTGLTRFVAVCLLAGYVWLAVAGALLLAAVWTAPAGATGLALPGLVAGPLYDAWLHALLLGFVFGMIFGHAPIIFPAILQLNMAWKPRFYLHLILLQLSLLLRVAGALFEQPAWRQWGALGNALAIGLFLLSTVLAVIQGRGAR